MILNFDPSLMVSHFFSAMSIYAHFYLFRLSSRLKLMIIFLLTNLMHKFFILIHLLYSSTCLEHYYAHLQEDKLC